MRVLQKSKIHNHAHFLAHGMGLVSHEAPRLTNSGPVPYDAYDADRPLETGMVVSVETTLAHPNRGFIKLEDTVIVTRPDLKSMATASAAGIEPAEPRAQSFQIESIALPLF